MTTVASGNAVANHSIVSISKYASHCKSNGGFVIQPPILDNLYGLVHTEYESKTEELSDSMIENGENNHSVEDEQETTETNQRFYVDETNMIERRFLADDTSKFKEKRDVDPFATSVLHDSILDCVWEYLNIEKDLKVLRQEIFLNGIKHKESTDQENMIIHIARDEWRKHSVESIRHACRWDWGSDSATKDGLESSAMTHLSRFLTNAGTYDAIAMTGIIWSKTILVEKSSLNQWIEFGARPGKDSDEILWIREVPDGFLGVSSTAGMVREYTRRLKMTGQLYSSETFTPKEKQPYKVPTIVGIQEILTKNGIEFSKKDKKPELTRLLDQKLLWEIY
jgi:hypothetical protein